MRSRTTVPFLVRGAIVAVLAVIAVGLVLAGSSVPGERSAEAALLMEVEKLLASDGETGDGFGTSVAISGDTAVVGAYGENAGGSRAGAAYIFGRDEGGANNWGEVKKLVASDAEAYDEFSVSVAISGDTAVVGAWLEDVGGVPSDNFGAAYVFERDEGGADNWGQVKKLTASDAEAGDYFGRSVATSGDTAVVGADYEDAGGNSAGAAYVFERDEGGADNWGQVKKLTAIDAQAGDRFGFSVATSGDITVVGAWWEDARGSEAGAAYVFGRDEGGADRWGQVKKLTASDAQTGDNFGGRVAVSGDTAVVGASGEDAGGSRAGAAYVFGRDDGGADNWGEVTKLTASDAQAYDMFGSRVAVSGDTAVVGASGNDAGGVPLDNFGAAYVFQRDEGGAGSWGEAGKLTASDAEAGDHFGSSVAVSGDTAVVGAGRADAAYVLESSPTKPTPTPPATPSPTPTPTPKQPEGDTDGDTVPNSEDTDDDNDGCFDVAEEQTTEGSETTGGLRNPHSFWDLMSVFTGNPLMRDTTVSVADIAAVVGRFGAIGDTFDRNRDPLSTPNKVVGDQMEDYHPSYDRGGSDPTRNVWNLLPPDGVISVGDITAAVNQFGHAC